MVRCRTRTMGTSYSRRMIEPSKVAFRIRGACKLVRPLDKTTSSNVCRRFHLLSHPDLGGIIAMAGFCTGVFCAGAGAAGGMMPELPHPESATANGQNSRTGTFTRSGTPGRRVCGRYTALKPPRRRWGTPVLMPRRYTRKSRPIWP